MRNNCNYKHYLCNYKHYLCNYKLFGFVKLASALISIYLCLMLNYALAFLFYVRTYVFNLTQNSELVAGGRTFFEDQWAGALLVSPGQIVPQCHSEQFCH